MTIFLIIQIIVVVCLVGVILMQRSSSDGFTGGSGGNSLMSGRASANFLTRTTAILATIFIINSLVLAYMASNSERGGSVVEKVLDKESKQENPVEVQVPLDDVEEGVDLESLKKNAGEAVEAIDSNVVKPAAEAVEKINNTVKDAVVPVTD